MRTPVSENQMPKANTVNSVEALSYSAQMSYHEMADVPLREINLLEQLQANLETLSDLQARTQFMSREIRYLMKA